MSARILFPLWLPNQFDSRIPLVDSKTTDLFAGSMLLQQYVYRACTANTSGQVFDMVFAAVRAFSLNFIQRPRYNNHHV
jgi:hypothetical protein